MIRPALTYPMTPSIPSKLSALPASNVVSSPANSSRLNVPFTTAGITVTFEEVDLFGSGSLQLSCPRLYYQNRIRCDHQRTQEDQDAKREYRGRFSATRPQAYRANPQEGKGAQAN